MSTAEHRASEAISLIDAEADKIRVAIVVSQWYYEDITGPMLCAAEQTLRDAGVRDKHLSVYFVPGTFELTYAAARLMKHSDVDVVIVFGCVVRGETPHFDYVCNSVTQGITALNVQGKKPVVFGVLTTNDKQQAIDRVNGATGNKGAECAEVALKMVDFSCGLHE
jgi:6,7-dimethyl-8-ribityllumazine synthase